MQQLVIRQQREMIQQESHVLPHSNMSLPAVQTSCYGVVAVAASLGGLRALSQVLAVLPRDFPVAIAVVQHLAPDYPSQLATILNRRTFLIVKQAESGELLRPGTVYIAPPNQHLLVNLDRTLCLSSAEKVHFVRPAATKLFESVAASFRKRAIAVVLTGRGNDGAPGVEAIKKMGGKVIAQDAASCDSFGMPSAAIATGSVDRVLPLNKIASALVSLVMPVETLEATS